MPNVVPNEPILADWGNAIRDRTIQRYDNATVRDSENATPTDGDLAFLEDTGDLQVFFNTQWRNFVPTGVVLPYAGATSPSGYLLCNGQAVSRTTYARLFAVIGTTYGAGDGSTTFNLPDLRQRFPLGKAASGTGDTLGETGGALTQTLTTSHLPSHSHGSGSLAVSSSGSHSHSSGSLTAASGGSHSHSIAVRSAPITAAEHGHPRFDRVSGASGATGDDANPSTVVQSGGAHTHSVTGSTASAGSHTHSVTGSTASAGSGSSFSKMPPYLVLNFVIKT